MKKSGTFFALSEDRSKPIMSSPGLSKADCVAKELPKTAFMEEESQLLCGFLKGDEISSFLKEKIYDQRVTFAFGSIVFFLYFLGALNWFWSGAKARAMLMRLKKIGEKEISEMKE